MRSDKHLTPTCLIDHARAKRLGEGLTMKELAAQLGIPFDTYVGWERHQSQPSGHYQVIIQGYLEMKPAEIGRAHV